VEALEHTYAYAGPSAVDPRGVALATSGGAGEHPYLFSGWIERPAAHAAALLAVARTARSRFTPGTRVFTDPVVCCERERLRFESLSSCCGVYARYDLDLDGDEARPGTTNVDFNPPMRDALARVGDGAPVHLAVGAEEVVLTSADGAVVERQVALPHRWVKGLGEVQLAQQLLLATALGAEQDSAGLAAVDATAAALADGRLDGDALDAALHTTIEPGHTAPRRVARRLATLADAEPAATAAIRRALEALPAAGRDAHHLLELLDDLCARDRAPVASTAARDWLAAQRGSTKTAKLARALLARS
jgi:hypothetical protein